MISGKLLGGGLVMFLLMGLPGAAYAQEGDGAVDLGLSYTADLVFTSSRGEQHMRYIDVMHFSADIDLDRLADLPDTSLHVDVINTLGERAEDGIGSLQGVNNNEVAENHVRLFEAWIEKRLSSTFTVRAGIYDLNDEFYVNEPAGLLVGSTFGIGAEVALTGSHGPSIYPTTALALRLDWQTDYHYLRSAIFNARAGVPGEPEGLDISFRDGLLVAAEAGLQRPGKLGLGFWQYTKRQPDVLGFGRHHSRGVYLLGDYPVIASEAGRSVEVFARLGISDGKASPVRGGWQAGLLMIRALRDHDDSQLSLGISQAWLSRGYRRQAMLEGFSLSKRETQLELTYTDRVTRFLALQPDIQYVINPGGDRSAQDALVLGLRLNFKF